MRRRWSDPGEPPGLIFVGRQTSIRGGCYRQLASDPPAGVTYLGPTTDRQLRALYRSAEALVFPSVYEGFGLPILEAMAAGTPVIALPFSSVPELGGDAVLYADGTSPAGPASRPRTVGDEPIPPRRAPSAGAGAGGPVPMGSDGPSHTGRLSVECLPAV